MPINRFPSEPPFETPDVRIARLEERLVCMEAEIGKVEHRLKDEQQRSATAQGIRIGAMEADVRKLEVSTGKIFAVVAAIVSLVALGITIWRALKGG